MGNWKYFAKDPQVPWRPDLYDWFQEREDIGMRGPVPGWSAPCANLSDPY